MFASVLSGLSSGIFSAAKSTVDAYKPSNIYKSGGGFERLSQQWIANISYRSPILADVAQNMLSNFQLEMVKKQRFQEYINSDSSKGMRESVSKTLGGTPDTKKIDQEMLRILTKLGHAIDEQGIEETKKSQLFQKFGDFFTHAFDESTHSTNNHNQSENHIDDELLNRIEANTRRTFNVLEELFRRETIMGGHIGEVDGVTSTPPTPSGHSTSHTPNFIDPYTGLPSIRAAVGHIGGSFLTKVFDDHTISRFAKKTKNYFGFEDDPEMQPTDSPVPTPTPKDGFEVEKEINKTRAPDDVPPESPITQKDSTELDKVTELINNTSLDLDDKKPTTKETSSELDKVTELISGISLDLGDKPTTKETSSELDKVTNLLSGISLDLGDKPITKETSSELDKVTELISGISLDLDDKPITKKDSTELDKVTNLLSGISLDLGDTKPPQNRPVSNNPIANLPDNIPTLVPKPTKVKDTSEIVNNILKNISLDLNTDVNENTKVAAKNKDTHVISVDNNNESYKEGFTKITTENTSESAKETEVAAVKRAEKSDDISEQILEELKKLNKTVEKNSKEHNSTVEAKEQKNTLLEKAKEAAKDKLISKVPKTGSIGYRAGNVAGKSVSKAISMGKSAAKYASESKIGQMATRGMGSLASTASKAIPVLAEGGSILGSLAAGAGSLISGAGSLIAGSAIAPFILPALGVAGAGAVGYGAGKLISPMIDKGLSVVSGKDTTLAGVVYDAMNGSKNKEISDMLKGGVKPTTTELPTPTNNNIRNTVNTLTTEKAKIEEASKAIPPQVIIAGGNNNSSSGGVSSIPTTISNPSVRNTDSTYERVQMQDFWPRSA